MNELYLLVEICGETVAFRAAEVQSVIELGTVSPAPRAPAFIAGLAALRSRALTVIDCAHALEIDHPARDYKGSKAAVVEEGGHLYALVLDAVNDVVEASSKPDAVPAELSRGWHRVSKGMVETDLGAMLVVNLAALIAGPGEKKAA